MDAWGEGDPPVDPWLVLVAVAVLVFAMPSVVWFYAIRRKMILRQRAVVTALEEVLRPRDKRYTLLGYLVGFRADYVLDGVLGRAWVLYTMPPGHVFFYLPVIILRGEKERLTITFRPRGRVPYTAHLVAAGDRWARRTFTIDYGPGFLEQRCELEGGFYRCGSGRGLERLSELAERLRGLGAELRRASLDEKANAVHVQAVIERVDPWRLVGEVKRFAEGVVVA